MTPAQRRALRELWPRYGIDSADALSDLQAVFKRPAPVCCEIGFGNGEAYAAFAQRHPEYNYLGIEVHRPGIGSLLRRLAAADVDNARVLVGDANEALARIPDAALAAVYLFFPDPWPKKRHHKRRLVQPAFAALVARKLMRHGIFHAATDWPDYAGYIFDVLEQTSGLANAEGRGSFIARPSTKYERHAIALGHTIRDLIFQRVD